MVNGYGKSLRSGFKTERLESACDVLSRLPLILGSAGAGSDFRGEHAQVVVRLVAIEEKWLQVHEIPPPLSSKAMSNRRLKRVP